MELFPAADEEQFAYIKRVIDDCDYYLLIIGGRYGSLTKARISYTEQEYDYALSRGLKVIALLHESPDEIPFGNREQDPELREKLQQFRAKVADKRMVAFWKTAVELSGLVALSLSKTMRMFPAVGWVRANRAANEDVLGEINELRKHNEQLQATLSKLGSKSRPSIKDLAGLILKIDSERGVLRHVLRAQGKIFTSATWRELFAYVAPYLVKFPSQDSVKPILALALFLVFGQERRE